ncbi:unnamed protein product [Soboliphyme baturini]|uniref:Omp85 domain-containing protein n=1 Tax=Soboliphyme baturini TaxID=241478 RepID=A0A183INC6_9BILA|nr:unnamed protein product [Soboliphyme baturini]
MSSHRAGAFPTWQTCFCQKFCLIPYRFSSITGKGTFLQGVADDRFDFGFGFGFGFGFDLRVEIHFTPRRAEPVTNNICQPALRVVCRKLSAGSVGCPSNEDATVREYDEGPTTTTEVM